MNDVLMDILYVVVTAIVSVAVTWIKRESYDIQFEDKYCKYLMIFELSGGLVKMWDEKLYEEMAECVRLMKKAYTSPEFTPSAFNKIVKESKDVFDRVQELMKNRS